MSRLRVLLVDDEQELVQTMAERLFLRGIDADVVTKGQDALKKMSAQSYDAVIVDVKMPGMGGIELLNAIKQTCDDQKIILLTGHADTNDAEAGIRLGAYDYLLKPVDINTLCKIIHKAVGAADPF
jgi:DNA-binding NtrC family response regulator